MEYVINIVKAKLKVETFMIDFLVVLFVYFVPAISHLLAFPVYYLDPMRIALIIALVHTSKRNTFIIAVSLPLFSFIITSHPSFIKTFLLSGELLLNLSIFFLLKDKIKNLFITLLLSIAISKIIYYLVKFILINLNLLDDKLFSTPYYFQILSAVLLSTYIFWINKRNLIR